jgi:hypothetical protein
VYLADGGGGGVSTGPSYSGTQTLKIEPSAIPGALNAFRAAEERVGRKLEELRSLEIREWAKDPVSGKTATQFDQRTHSGANSALDCLTGYRKQLKAAVESLEDAHRSYLLTEGTNSDKWGIYT